MILCTTNDLKKYLEEIRSTTKKDVLLEEFQNISNDIKDQIQIILTYGNYDDRLSVGEIEQLPNLKWVQAMSSGTEQLPLDYLTKKKIVVTSAKGIHRIPISEYVMGMILYFSKKISEFNREKARKNWNTAIEITEIYGKTIGILGTGYIGTAIAARAKAFGMRTVGVNRSGGEIDHFDEIYTISELPRVVGRFDYLCSVLPSNSKSIGLINRNLIQLMKDGVNFINVGRGDLINEEDFLDALQKKKIRWAALDVFNKEPLDKHHPFWDVENLVITPHASALTSMYIRRCLDIFYKNYRYFTGNEPEKMINLINYGKGGTFEC